MSDEEELKSSQARSSSRRKANPDKFKDYVTTMSDSGNEDKASSKKGNQCGTKSKHKGKGNKKDGMTCISCSLTFPTILLECERCTGIFCRTCTNKSKEEYDGLLAGIAAKLHWYCDECNMLAMEAVQTDKLIEDRCLYYMSKCSKELEKVKRVLEDKIDSEVSGIKEEQSKLKGEILKIKSEDLPNLRKEMSDMKTGEIDKKQIGELINDKISENADSGLSEMSERNNRKSNLIVFNLPESTAEDVGSRRTHDSTHFSAICASELGIEVDIAPRQVTRLGKPQDGNDKPRPLRVCLKSEESQKDILANAKKLARSTVESSKKIFIKRDMTPLEREEDAKLRSLRDKKNKESQEKGEEITWIIRRNKVVSLSGRRQGNPPTT